MEMADLTHAKQRREAARSDTARFRKESSKDEAGPFPSRVTSAALQSSLQLLAPVASEHFNPADRRHSTSNNQPEIRRKRAGRRIAAERNKRTRY